MFTASAVEGESVATVELGIYMFTSLHSKGREGLTYELHLL